VNDRLYRSVDDRVIAGVCGGLAVRMGIDPSLVRIGYAILTIVTGIFPLVVLYVIMAAVVPPEPTGFGGIGRAPAAGAMPGWTPPPPGSDAMPGWTPPGAATGAAPTDPTAAWPADPSARPETAAGPAGQGPAPGSPTVPTAAEPWRAARRRDGRGRQGDALPAVIAGIGLVGLGLYLLLRDVLDVDWSVVWPAALIGLGCVVLIAAFRRGG